MNLRFIWTKERNGSLLNLDNWSQFHGAQNWKDFWFSKNWKSLRWLTIDQADRLWNQCEQLEWYVSCKVAAGCKWISDSTSQLDRHFCNFEAEWLWNCRFLPPMIASCDLFIRLQDFHFCHKVTNRVTDVTNDFDASKSGRKHAERIPLT